MVLREEWVRNGEPSQKQVSILLRTGSYPQDLRHPIQLLHLQEVGNLLTVPYFIKISRVGTVPARWALGLAAGTPAPAHAHLLPCSDWCSVHEPTGQPGFGK